MSDKTGRILSYLPGTFRPSEQRSALRAFVGAFGNELQQAENSLAAIMQAHWVDHADRGAKVVDDLACLAALYGLAPRVDEGVEEFREHLKRYIRTFIEGSVTVQGIFRITAESLGIKIADSYEDMNAWWNRSNSELVTFEPDGDDAAEMIFGQRSIRAQGSSAMPARAAGTIDLSQGADLRGATKLRLKIDGKGSIDIDMDDKGDLSSVSIERIEGAIKAKLDNIARHDGPYLILSSPTSGAASSMEVQDVTNDAADRILGLAPRTYQGCEATPADVRGVPDLKDGLDLSGERYLRLLIDGTDLAEIDCAGIDPVHTTLDEIRDAINKAMGISNLAGHDGHHLRLTSPTKGFSSSITFQQPASQDATGLLFSPATQFYTGRDAAPAQVTGRKDLSGDVNLSLKSNLQLKIDKVSRNINCAGDDPARTNLDEIVAAINAAFGTLPASRNGKSIVLTSPTNGSTSEIVLERPDEGDATEIIFGFTPRIFKGAQETAAFISSVRDLSSGIDLRARRLLNLAVDGGNGFQINLSAGAVDIGAVTLVEISDNINKALGPGSNVASNDGIHLVLKSSTPGRSSSMTIEPLLSRRRRNFVTRATIVDEAATAVFGFVESNAGGVPSTSAIVTGKADLGGGVDLTTASYLRIALDNRPAVDINCSGPRPRATTIDDVVLAINDDKVGLGPNVADKDRGHLTLTSPASGSSSKIAFSQPRPTDALDKLLGKEPGAFKGVEASGVRFAGTVDLSRGVDLGDNAAIKIGIDGAESVQIDLSGKKTANQIVTSINSSLQAANSILGNVAGNNNGAITLASPSRGSKSSISFESAGENDVTKSIFGIAPPRRYQGLDPAKARVVGVRDLSGVTDLSRARFLRLTVDGTKADVDCASQVKDPSKATLEEIVKSINADATLVASIASPAGSYLKLTSVQSGPSGQIVLDYRTSEDARTLLLGDVDEITKGTDPKPAVITGTADLLGPVDLSQRSLIRLEIDGNEPRDIDVAGAFPQKTSLDEVEAAINKAFESDIAGHTDDGHITITSPTLGEGGLVSLLPLRYLEIIEYLPVERTGPDPAPKSVVNGDSWSVNNNGVADVYARVEITAPHGSAGIALQNASAGWQVRLLTTLAAGEKASLWNDPEQGLVARIISEEGAERPVPGGKILVGPQGSQVWVPFKGDYPLSVDDEGATELQLNNPSASGLVILRSRTSGAETTPTVSVTEAGLPAPSSTAEAAATDGSLVRLIGRLRNDGTDYRLVDAVEGLIARLRQGPGVDLAIHANMVVSIIGPVYQDGDKLMVVEQIDDLFDIMIKGGSTEEPESYSGVTIGSGSDPWSLLWRLNTGSKLVKAEEIDKGTVLRLPRGWSNWRYLDCQSARFDQAKFDQSRFAGGRCCEPATFDISRFGFEPGEPVAAVFASIDQSQNHPSQVTFYWESYIPGAFTVNLPWDLPDRFGGRFNDARFGRGPGDTNDTYLGAVTEPIEDAAYLVTNINKNSTLAVATKVDRVPLGWSAVTMPFSEPQFLTLGKASSPACIYLAEKGLPGFIAICAKENGVWGNDIAVTAKPAGPAQYNVDIIYKGARFEVARQIVLGLSSGDQTLKPCSKGNAKPSVQAAPVGGLPTLIQDLLKPGAVGVLQAKAAGICAKASRDRSYQG